jgi:hypothetical protein
MACLGICLMREKCAKAYHATWTKVERYTPRTFRRELPFDVGIALHLYSKRHAFIPLLERDVGPRSCKMTSSDQNDILPAAYSQTTFPGERKPLVNVLDYAFSEVSSSCCVLALGWQWKG